MAHEYSMKQHIGHDSGIPYGKSERLVKYDFIHLCRSGICVHRLSTVTIPSSVVQCFESISQRSSFL